MKVRTQIAPGICNFDATVTASTEDSQNVTFEFESEFNVYHNSDSDDDDV